MVPAAYGERGTRLATVLGPSFIAGSPSVCTQTYLFFYVGSQKKANSLNSYLRTRFFRFLVSLRKITQHATRSTYTWVPQQAWDRTWTDEALYNGFICFIRFSFRFFGFWPVWPSRLHGCLVAFATRKEEVVGRVRLKRLRTDVG